MSLKEISPPVEPVRSVYVHAPFCRRRCPYCSFPVKASRHPDWRGWLRALEWEWRLVEEEGRFSLGTPLQTLFVGGGTPSLLPPQAMTGLGAMVGRERLEGSELEWTAEANPESLARSVAEGWVRAGVNRISIGIQSFQDEALRWLQRLHDSREAVLAVARARGAGIRNISLDLMFGLPPGVERIWEKDLDRALSLQVPHLSLYGLAVEPGTSLAGAMNRGIVPPPDEEEYRDQFLTAAERLAREGYEHYEVSNFALPGSEARHNQVYWELKPYLGLGNGAHSFSFPRRRWNLRDWSAYQSACLEGGSPWEGDEVLGPGEARLERIWLGLRTRRGLRMEDLGPEARALAGTWTSRGEATTEGGVLRLTALGWLVLDERAVELDLAMG